MEKPASLSGLNKVLDDLGKDYRKWWNENITKKVKEYEKKLEVDNCVQIKSYQDKLNEVRDAIGEKKRQLLENKKPFDEKLIEWIKREFQSGVDFGYGGISLRYVDPQERYIIVTNNGGTAGTGTAMGTGSYYYANCDHFVVFPQFGNYMEASFPDGRRRARNSMFTVEGGRLTNEVKESLIKQADDYCNKWNIKPFKLWINQ